MTVLAIIIGSVVLLDLLVLGVRFISASGLLPGDTDGHASSPILTFVDGGSGFGDSDGADCGGDAGGGDCGGDGGGGGGQ